MSEQASEPTAAQVATPAETPAIASGVIERAVAFFLGGQRYAVPIESVNEIQQIVAFSDVPYDGSAVVGMINLRSRRP